MKLSLRILFLEGYYFFILSTFLVPNHYVTKNISIFIQVPKWIMKMFTIPHHWCRTRIDIDQLIIAKYTRIWDLDNL